MKSKVNIYEQVGADRVPYSQFDLSHTVRTTCKIGELVPTLVMDIVPGDRFSLGCETMSRLMPLVAPVMGRLRFHTEYFFVPNRLLWDGWEEYIVNGDNQEQHPYFTLSGSNQIAVGSLLDQLGYPLSVPAGYKFNPMPIAAYHLIYDEYYRRQYSIAEKFKPLVYGDNSTNYAPYYNLSCLLITYEHDYFTAALPFAQAGDPVQLPLTTGGTVPVEYVPSTESASVWLARRATDDTLQTGDILSSTIAPFTGGVINANGDKLALDPQDRLKVDINSEAVSINTFRRALAIQKWLEKMARGGSRYIEQIWAHFRKKSDDARLQRPEYLGRISGNISFSEVLATAETDVTAQLPVGSMAGHGIGYEGGTVRPLDAKEHGWLIGITSFTPVTNYSQGCPRKLNRFDRFDYLWPLFANIGEQEVKNQELYLSSSMTIGTATGNTDATFGYQSRYMEYRDEPDRSAGLMRSTLDFWHLGRKFSAVPTLTSTFLEVNPSEFDKLFAVSEQAAGAQIVLQVRNVVYATRPLPMYAIPQ